MEEAPASKDLLRIAVVGCGRMGRLHAERLARDGRGRIVALFDIDPGAAQDLAGSMARDAEIYPRFSDLVERGEFDAAIICTPTQLHFQHVADLTNRGAPILCEKPLARTRDEIVGSIANLRRTGTLLSIAYQRRLLATYRTLRRLVRSQSYGPVRAILSHNIENWQQMIAGTWRDDPQANFGGFIGDAGSHKIDIAFFVTGLSPTEVFARCDRCGSRVEVTASVSALLSGAVPCTMDFIGNTQYFSEMLSVHCAEADLVLRDGEVWIGRAGASERVPITEADSNPVTAFLDILLNGAENFAPPECALPVFDMTQGILESARTGRSIPLDLAGTTESLLQ